MKKYLGILLVVISFFSTSCNKNFLDVSEELAEEMDMEKIFSNPTDVRRFHRELYNGVPNSMNLAGTSEYNIQSLKGQGNQYAYLSDDLCDPLTAFPYTRPVNPSDGFVSRWTYYRLIRQANLFLENAREIPAGGQADFIGLVELKELVAQARFFRAYYHYLIFEVHGPIPLMTSAVDPSDPNLDFERNSVDEVVEFIYNELTAVANELKDPDVNNQEQLGVPTKGTALAIRARLMVYAASPLFNGGYEEALTLANTDGKLLFPAKDDTKWERALEALQEFIDYANAGHYELYKEFKNSILDPYGSVYGVHMKYNKEIIFARTEDNISAVTRTLDRINVPRGARGGATYTGGLAVTQELVDAFHMIDGFSIEESDIYREDGYSEEGEDLSGQTETGTYRMFINREPRFYQAVFYNGRKWHIGNEQIWFNDGGNSDRSGSRFPRTGHLLYKRMSQRVYAEGSHPRDEYRPPIVHRLAEFYLLYAEVLNEVNPGDSRVIEYIDQIRERAGIPLLANIKPEIIGNQEAQREAIRTEMRVELATEGGQRYFDLKRWMIAEQVLSGPFYGMDIAAPTLDGFYNRVVVHRRDFRRQNYLVPIPLNEIQKSRLLVQNPGY